jgi:hypothetical protein
MMLNITTWTFNLMKLMSINYTLQLVVCNAGRFGNYRAAARQPGVVPGKKKKMQNN